MLLTKSCGVYETKILVGKLRNICRKLSQSLPFSSFSLVFFLLLNHGSTAIALAVRLSKTSPAAAFVYFVFYLSAFPYPAYLVGDRFIFVCFANFGWWNLMLFLCIHFSRKSLTIRYFLHKENDSFIYTLYKAWLLFISGHFNFFKLTKILNYFTL